MEQKETTKKTFEKPEIEIIELELTDVITTSTMPYIDPIYTNPGQGNVDLDDL